MTKYTYIYTYARTHTHTHVPKKEAIYWYIDIIIVVMIAGLISTSRYCNCGPDLCTSLANHNLGSDELNPTYTTYNHYMNSTTT